jgi:hypothetical protein
MVFDWRASNDVACVVLNTNGSSGKNNKTHRYCIRSLAIQRHFEKLYSGGGDSFVCLWDLRKPDLGKPVESVVTGNFVVDVRVDCDNVFVSQQAGGKYKACLQQYSSNLLHKVSRKSVCGLF